MELTQLSDLKIGMWLKNEAAVDLPLYDNKEGNSPVALWIKPGEMIGQIVDFGNGPYGNTVIFTSDKIRADQGIISKGLQWLLSWSSGTYYGAAARFINIQRAVMPAQAKTQREAIDYAEAHGTSLKTQFFNAAHSAASFVGDTFTELFPWKLALGGIVVWALVNKSKSKS